MTVTTFPSLVAEQATHLTVDVQRQLAAYALREATTKPTREAILSALIVRDDLDAELEAELLATGELAAVATWVRQPQRTREELLTLLGREKRVSALLPLAHAEGLHAAAYQQLASRQSVRLDEALVTNHDVPDQVRLAVLRRLATSSSSRNASSSRVRKLAGPVAERRPDLLAAAVVDEAVSSSWAEFALRSGVLEPRAAGQLIRRQLQAAFDTRRSDLQRRQLLLQIASQPLRYDDAAAAAQLARQLHTDGSLPIGFQIHELVNQRGGMLDRLIEQMLTAEDAATVTDAYQQADELATEGVSRSLLSSAALSAPAADDALLVDAACRLKATTGALTQALRRAERSGRYQLIGQLGLRSSYAGRLLHQLDDPARALRAIAAAAVAEDARIPHTVRNSPLVDQYPDLAVSMLSCADLLEHASPRHSRTGDAGPTATAAADAITAALGADPDQWEALTSLAPNYEGSLAQLLATVRQL